MTTLRCGVTFNDIKTEAIAEWQTLKHSGKPHILIGTATCGRAAGALTVLETVNTELVRHKIDAITTQVGCIGLCYAEPLVTIIKPDKPAILYGNATPEIIAELIEDYIVSDNPRPDLALGFVGDGKLTGIPKLFDLPVFKAQKRILLENCN